MSPQTRFKIGLAISLHAAFALACRLPLPDGRGLSAGIQPISTGVETGDQLVVELDSPVLATPGRIQYDTARLGVVVENQRRHVRFFAATSSMKAGNGDLEMDMGASSEVKISR